MKDWKRPVLEEVCKFVRGPFGGSLKKEIFKAEGYAVYEQQHAIYNQFSDIRYFVDDTKFSQMRRFELSADDLIMSCSGTMGKVAIVPKGIKRGIINQALLKITPSSKIDVKYLRYWMESDDFQGQISASSAGAAIQNVASVKVLSSMKIPLPPLDEQKRIAAILDQADALRRLRTRAIDRLNALGQAIFHETFGDGTKAPLRTISSFAEVKGGKRLPKGAEYSDSVTSHPYIRVSDIGNLRIATSSLKYITPATHQAVRRYIVNSGDVVISIAGSIGLTASVPVSLSGANLTENAAKITHLSGQSFDATYLAWALSMPEAQSQIASKTGQVTISKLALFRIEQIEVPFPSLQRQRQFADAITEFDHRVSLFEKALVAQNTLFTSLQHRAFRGEL